MHLIHEETTVHLTVRILLDQSPPPGPLSRTKQKIVHQPLNEWVPRLTLGPMLLSFCCGCDAFETEEHAHGQGCGHDGTAVAAPPQLWQRTCVKDVELVLEGEVVGGGRAADHVVHDVVGAVLRDLSVQQVLADPRPQASTPLQLLLAQLQSLL